MSTIAVLISEWLDCGDKGIEVLFQDQYREMEYTHAVLFILTGRIEVYSPEYYDVKTKYFNPSKRGKYPNYNFSFHSSFPKNPNLFANQSELN